MILIAGITPTPTLVKTLDLLRRLLCWIPHTVLTVLDQDVELADMGEDTVSAHPAALPVVLPSMEEATVLTPTTRAHQHRQAAMGQQLTIMVDPHQEAEEDIHHKQTDMDHLLLNSMEAGTHMELGTVQAMMSMVQEHRPMLQVVCCNRGRS